MRRRGKVALRPISLRFLGELTCPPGVVSKARLSYNYKRSLYEDGIAARNLMSKRILILVVLALAGCKQTPEVPTIIKPYRIDIQQGNVVTQEMVSKLKPGMTRAQVRF